MSSKNINSHITTNRVTITGRDVISMLKGSSEVIGTGESLEEIEKINKGSFPMS